MSVKTRADEHRDSAKEHLQAAIENLSEIVINQCWGADEYTAEYQKTLGEVLWTLVAQRERL